MTGAFLFWVSGVGTLAHITEYCGSNLRRCLRVIPSASTASRVSISVTMSCLSLLISLMISLSLRVVRPSMLYDMIRRCWLSMCCSVTYCDIVGCGSCVC